MSGSAVRGWAFALAIGMAAGLCGAASAAPFQNGGFETGPSPGGSFITLGAGDTSITGWTVGGNGIDYIGPYWQPSEGSRSIDLNAGDAGAMSQTFDTLTGATYRVTFALAGNPTGDVKTGFVQAGATTQDFTFDTAGKSTSDMGWTDNVFDFVAGGPSTTLSFVSTIHSNAGPALDDVRVMELAAPVPVPAALPLMGGALAVLGLLRRRKAK